MPADPDRIRRARELRRAMTPAETILWRELRGRRFAGFKFRRQRPVGPYVADFYCYSCALIVELDGESHLGRENEDQIRQTNLEACGPKVLRFWNSDVYDDRESVLEAIYRECQQRCQRLKSRCESGRALTPVPSPAKPGEGELTTALAKHSGRGAINSSPLSRLCGRGDGGEGDFTPPHTACITFPSAPARRTTRPVPPVSRPDV